MGNTKRFQIQVDGNWAIKVNTYNKENVKVTTNTVEVTRDTVAPITTNIGTTSLTATTWG